MSKIVSYMSDIPAQITPAPAVINLIDDDGKIINKPNAYHKNKVYKQAKELRDKLRDILPTKDEHWNPTRENVNKVLTRELKNPKIESFQLAMKSLGADPKDYNIERIRRGRK
jgi:phosphoketolase